jgi:hypothetical protein
MMIERTEKRSRMENNQNSIGYVRQTVYYARILA